MAAFFPHLSEVKDLNMLQTGQGIEVRLNGALFCEGKVEQMDAELGVVWVRDRFNERKLLNSPDFSFWRYVL